MQSAEEKIGTVTNWKQTFQYDRFGNRRFDAANTTTLGQSNNITNPTIDTATNRFSTGQNYLYDKAGSLTNDAEGRQFIYDAENHQKEVRNSAGTPVGLYEYDGEGKRVKKNSSLETTIFDYNAGGTLVAEYSTQVAPTQQVSYLTQDHLGSPRVITNENGAVTTRQDFAAFGDETLTAQRTEGLGYKPDSIRQDYTGYQKDEESGGLEFAQARYYNTKHGRFTSIDPLTASANVKDPQTFNRYSYAMNSPYKFTDPLGLISSTTGATGDFVDEDGYVIGSDGEDNKTLYFVPNEADRKTIIKNTKSSLNTKRPTVTALELPNEDVRQEVADDAVERTENKTTDDKKGEFHEDGGAVYEGGENGQIAVPAKPGAKGTPGPGGEASINVLDPANPDLMKQVTDNTPLITYHAHPPGVASKVRVGPNGTTQSLQDFQQTPSQTDLANYGKNPSKLGYSIVVGAGSKTIMNEGQIRPNPGGQRVTFYNTKILGSMSREGFLKAGRKR